MAMGARRVRMGWGARVEVGIGLLFLFCRERLGTPPLYSCMVEQDPGSDDEALSPSTTRRRGAVDRDALTGSGSSSLASFASSDDESNFDSPSVSGLLSSTAAGKRSVGPAIPLVKEWGKVSTKAVAANVAYLTDNYLGQHIPFSLGGAGAAGKAAVVSACCGPSATPRSLPSFNKLSGVMEWANAVALFVNVGGHDYNNVFAVLAPKTQPRTQESQGCLVDEAAAATAARPSSSHEHCVKQDEANVAVAVEPSPPLLAVKSEAHSGDADGAVDSSAGIGSGGVEAVVGSSAESPSTPSYDPDSRVRLSWFASPSNTVGGSQLEIPRFSCVYKRVFNSLSLVMGCRTFTAARQSHITNLTLSSAHSSTASELVEAYHSWQRWGVS